VKQKINFIFGAVYFFSKEHDMQNTQDVLDLYHLSSEQQKHSKSQTHMPCYLALKLFGKQQNVDLLLNAERRNDVKPPR